MVAIFFANGTEEVEALLTVDFLRRCDFEVEILAVNDTNCLEIIGAHDIVVKADKHVLDANFDDYECIVFPGGIPGVNNIINNDICKQMLFRALNEKKLVAAICAAPAILSQYGLIDNKKATCYPAMNDILSENGAYYIDEDVVVDDMLITSRAAGTTHKFAKVIAEKLGCSEVAKKVYQGMVFE